MWVSTFQRVRAAHRLASSELEVAAMTAKQTQMYGAVLSNHIETVLTRPVVREGVLLANHIETAIALARIHRGVIVNHVETVIQAGGRSEAIVRPVPRSTGERS
jgi:hypothetical protein